MLFFVVFRSIRLLITYIHFSFLANILLCCVTVFIKCFLCRNPLSMNHKRARSEKENESSTDSSYTSSHSSPTNPGTFTSSTSSSIPATTASVGCDISHCPYSALDESEPPRCWNHTKCAEKDCSKYAMNREMCNFVDVHGRLHYLQRRCAPHNHAKLAEARLAIIEPKLNEEGNNNKKRRQVERAEHRKIKLEQSIYASLKEAKIIMAPPANRSRSWLG